MIFAVAFADPVRPPAAVGQDGTEEPRSTRILEFPNLGPIPGSSVPTFALDASITGDEGSPAGITLDEAIDRMMACNLDINAIRHEIPQADADILTAGLRTHPLVYVDTQFIPYGSFNDRQPAGVAGLEPRGGLKDLSPPPPNVDDLVRLAIEGRPDLVAMRRGVGRAQAEVDLQRTSAVDDLNLFHDPITVQNFGPYNRSDASSWAVGLTYSVPIFNRNQGNIARARTNVCQTRRELDAAERRVESEVRLAEREYRTSRQALERIERGILPAAAASLRRHIDEFSRGESDADELNDRFDDAAVIAQSLREALVRHRRSMLELNAAIGVRILP